jgi:ribosome-associated heat shock protein Hsp15
MSDTQSDKKIRLDKWLWAARFYKTRSIARDMINGGKVHYNGQRTKASKVVELGALLTIRQGDTSKQISIEQLSDQRRSAPIAESLYQETSDSIKKREAYSVLRKLSLQNAPHPDKKPNKKQRRELIKAKSQRNSANFD